jgi:hypothetical protein
MDKTMLARTGASEDQTAYLALSVPVPSPCCTIRKSVPHLSLIDAPAGRAVLMRLAAQFHF